MSIECRSLWGDKHQSRQRRRTTSIYSLNSKPHSHPNNRQRHRHPPRDPPKLPPPPALRIRPGPRRPFFRVPPPRFLAPLSPSIPPQTLSRTQDLQSPSLGLFAAEGRGADSGSGGGDGFGLGVVARPGERGGGERGGGGTGVARGLVYLMATDNVVSHQPQSNSPRRTTYRHITHPTRVTPPLLTHPNTQPHRPRLVRKGRRVARVPVHGRGVAGLEVVGWHGGEIGVAVVG